MPAQMKALTVDAIRAGLFADPWLRQFNDWLTDDLGSMFEMDVYAKPFPTARGWEIYENDRARILLVRQESLAGLAGALAALYRIDPATIDVVRANEGGNKSYSKEYQTVRRNFQLSKRELEDIYSMPYVRHFYTPEEVAEFKRYWGSAPADRSTLSSNVPVTPCNLEPAGLRDRSIAGFVRSLAHRVYLSFMA